MHTLTQLALPLDDTLGLTLTDWQRHGIAAGHAARTIDARAETVRRLARVVHDPLTATGQDLIDWLATQPVQRSSRAVYRSQLRAFYGWLVATGRRLDDPSAALPKPRVPRTEPRPLTADEVDRVLAATAHPRAHTTRAMVVLACFAGLRVHEIAQVRGDDIRGGGLRVRGKGGALATVPLHPLVRALADVMPRAGWWFPGVVDGHVSRTSVGAAITRAMRRAGVAGTPHACRHFYGTQVLRAAGGNLRIAQRALRHADIRSTAIYTLVSDDELHQAIAGIPAGNHTRLHAV